MHPQTHAHDTLCSILNALKDSLAALPQHIASSPSPAQSTKPTSSTSKPAEKSNPEEIARLQTTIAQLKEEIGQSLSLSPASLTHTYLNRTLNRTSPIANNQNPSSLRQLHRLATKDLCQHRRNEYGTHHCSYGRC